MDKQQRTPAQMRAQEKYDKSRKKSLRLPSTRLNGNAADTMEALYKVYDGTKSEAIVAAATHYLEIIREKNA